MFYYLYSPFIDWHDSDSVNFFSEKNFFIRKFTAAENFGNL